VLHALSKISAFVWDPGTWVVAVGGLGVLLLFSRIERRKQWGRRLALLCVLMLMFFSWVGPANYLIAQMERPYSIPSSTDGFAGLLILGGVFVSPRTQDSYLPSLGCAAERVIEPVAMLAKNPTLQAVFLGGDGRLTSEPSPEANYAKFHFERLGVDLSRVRFEARSRNTFENAERGRELPGVDSNARWLLVTSAWHMTRSLATFRKSGWNVTPYPVDYFAPASIDWLEFSTVRGFAAWELYVKERVGLLVYRALGRA
jgi:uncharacterized SAM-binding protein YcdF (DUF218 family)